MEKFFTDLDRKIAHGDDVSHKYMFDCYKTYRCHAAAGMGNPLIEAGEEKLWGPSDNRKFTTNPDDLRVAAVMFGYAAVINIRLLEYQDLKDHHIAAIETARMLMVWTLLEIVSHPETEEHEKIGAFDIAIAQLLVQMDEDVANKLLRSRASIFPNAKPFDFPDESVRVKNTDWMLSHMPFDVSAVAPLVPKSR